MKTILAFALILGLLSGCPGPKSESTSSDEPVAKPAEKPKPQQKKPEPPPPPVAEKDRPIDELTVEDVCKGLLGAGVTEEAAEVTWKKKFVKSRVRWSGRVVGINNMGQSFTVEMAEDLMANVTPMELAKSLKLSQWVAFEATVRNREPYPMDWAPKAQSIQLSHGLIVNILPISPGLKQPFEDLSHAKPASRLEAVKVLGSATKMIFCNEIGAALLKVIESDSDSAVVLEGVKALMAVKKRAGKRFNIINEYNIMEALMGRLKSSSDEALGTELLKAAQGLEENNFGYHATAISDALKKATTPGLIAMAAAIMGKMNERHKGAAVLILEEKASKGATEETRKAASDALAGLEGGK